MWLHFLLNDLRSLLWNLVTRWATSFLQHRNDFNRLCHYDFIGLCHFYNTENDFIGLCHYDFIGLCHYDFNGLCHFDNTENDWQRWWWSLRLRSTQTMILTPSLPQTHNILGLKSVYTPHWRLQPRFILSLPCILMWILPDAIGMEDNKNKKAKGFQISHFISWSA